ncbi:MAG: TonB-dependent siderophore receptor [Rhizomicrobium sp.]
MRHISFTRILLSSAAVSALALSSAAAEPAQDTGSHAQDTGNIETVVVSAPYQFLNADTRGVTNLPLPIEKVPQSISLVSADFIKAADLKSISDVAEFTPGALNTGESSTGASTFTLRGFRPGLALDGINLPQSLFDNDPDYAIIERLEVVKGPSSVVYGISSPGGLVNMVTKSAHPDTPSYVTAQTGSWDSYRLEGQAAGALNADGSVRAIGVAVQDAGNSFIDLVRHSKTTLYGGVDADLSDTLSGYIHGGFERFERTSFEGIPGYPNGKPAPVPRSFFIGSQDQLDYTSLFHLEGSLDWHPTDMWELSLKGNYQASNLTGPTNYAYGLQPDGTMTVGFVRDVAVWNKNFGIGASAIYHLDDLGLKNSFLSVAALYQNNDQPIYETYPDNLTANLFSGEAAITQVINTLATNPQYDYRRDINIATLTLSAQSVIQIFDPLSVLLGVSYSKPDGNEVVNGVHQASVTDGQTSFRWAVTYEVVPGANAYVSYSESFNPQAIPSLLNGILPPLSGAQYEAGVKYRTDDGRLLLTGAVYRIGENNVAQYDQTVHNIDYYIGTGVTHKGVELQAIGRITSAWQINLGYSYLHTRINNPTRPAANGQEELYIPTNTASLFTTYTIEEGSLAGLSFGGGVRYVGDRRTSYATAVIPTFPLPSYTVVDATVAYTYEKWLLQLNAHNILNELYYVNNSARITYGNAAGAPANVMVSLTRQF